MMWKANRIKESANPIQQMHLAIYLVGGVVLIVAWKKVWLPAGIQIAGMIQTLPQLLG